MEAQLRVPYRDTAADDLVWRLGEPPRPALATLELDVAGGRLELRLLGGSHQVLFDAPGAAVSEVVACGEGTTGLPPMADRALGGWDYRFRSAAYRPAPAGFGCRVERLVALLSAHPAGIVGRFPGSPHAITGLLAGPGPAGDGVRWRTWHAYPQDGRLVTTGTTLRPR